MPNVAEAGALTAVAVVLEAGVMFQETALSDLARGLIMIFALLMLFGGIVVAIGYEVLYVVVDERAAGEEVETASTK